MNEILMAKAKRIAKKTHTPERLIDDLGEEFGRRVAMAIKDGVPMEAAFEACKINFRETGNMMVLIADNITLNMFPEWNKQ